MDSAGATSGSRPEPVAVSDAVTVTTIAGSGEQGCRDGRATAQGPGGEALSKLNLPNGLHFNARTGQLFIADSYSHRIRLLAPQQPPLTDSQWPSEQDFARGTVITIAGGSVEGQSDGEALGPGTSAGTGAGASTGVGAGVALFHWPMSVAVDWFGDATGRTLLIADAYNSRICALDMDGGRGGWGRVDTIAGGNGEGFVDGKGSDAKFCGCYAIAIDSVSGHVFVADRFGTFTRTLGRALAPRPTLLTRPVLCCGDAVRIIAFAC
jgi:hypothetical protein